jgi:hypothetical protein
MEPAGEAILGWSRQEAVGELLSNLYLPKDYHPRYIDIAAQVRLASKDAPLPAGQRFVYRTLSAANATEALAIVDDGADVIIPGAFNGRQLADEIARRRAGLRVLFTSGYTENAIIHHGRLDPGVSCSPSLIESWIFRE